MKLKSLMSLILTMILISPLAKADCNSVLKSCDAALKAQVDLNIEKNTQITNLGHKSELDEQLKADKDAQLASPLRDPIKVAATTTIVILVLEIVTGVFKK